MPVVKLHECLFGINPSVEVLVRLVTFNHSVLPEGQSIIHPSVSSLVVAIVVGNEGLIELFDDLYVICHAASDVISLLYRTLGAAIEEPSSELL